MNSHKVNKQGDIRKITENILREIELTIENCGGKVTFEGQEPIRKEGMINVRTLINWTIVM